RFESCAKFRLAVAKRLSGQRPLRHVRMGDKDTAATALPRWSRLHPEPPLFGLRMTGVLHAELRDPAAKYRPDAGQSCFSCRITGVGGAPTDSEVIGTDAKVPMAARGIRGKAVLFCELAPREIDSDHDAAVIYHRDVRGQRIDDRL